MCKLRAIVFDLDDTLYPERAYVLSGFRAVANWIQENTGIRAVDALEELLHLFRSGVRGNIFDLWLESRGFRPGDWVSQMVQVYREHQPAITPYPEVPALLAHIRLKYRLGMVTDGYATVQRRKLSALGLEPLFDAMVFSDDWGKKAWKPSTYPFKVVLDRLGVSGCEAVYIGDNPLKDFLGARLVGMRTVRIRLLEGLYSGLEPPAPEYAPDIELKSLGEIPQLLEVLGDVALMKSG